MKKIIAKILLVVLFVGMYAGCMWYETHYTLKNCKVIEASTEGVLIQDEMGENWFWESADFQIGDKVTMKLFDNHTSGNPFDDEILKVEKN